MLTHNWRYKDDKTVGGITLQLKSLQNIVDLWAIGVANAMNVVDENGLTVNTKSDDLDNRFSVKLGMSEEERYSELKDKSVKVVQYKNTIKEFTPNKYLNKNKSSIEKEVRDILRENGVFKKYNSNAIDVDFDFTGAGYNKSLHSQIKYGGEFTDFIDVVENLDELLHNSILLETHEDKGKGTNKENPRLKQVYVLLSAMQKEKNIVPVEFEIKQYIDDNNRLYLVVALTKIETSVMVDTALENQERTQLLPISNIKLADIFANVNIKDKNLLKYVPNQFLNDEQINAKNEALKVDKYNQKFSLKSNVEEAKFSTKDSEGKTLTPEQQEYFKDSKVRDAEGNLLKVYHGTDADFTVFDRTKGRHNMDIQGSFFSPWELDSQGYGANVKAYYLNITNPASEQMGYKALRMFQGQNNAGVKAREYLESLGYDGVNNSNEEYIAFNSNQIKLADNTNPTDNEDVRYSEKDYPINNDVMNIVDDAIINNTSNANVLSKISQEQNNSINRLSNVTGNDLYKGKFTGGNHIFNSDMIRHALNNHSDFLTEALRGQLPLNKKDIARSLSAIKDNKRPSRVIPSKTNMGSPSILTSFDVNGYTLYAEEIKKSLGKNIPSDLIGHTMYKAPTMSTASSYTTSMYAPPKRQSQVLYNYYMPKSNKMSSGYFVTDKDGHPILLSYSEIEGKPFHAHNLGGLIALSSNANNLTIKKGNVNSGYVIAKKPFVITENNKVFQNSSSNFTKEIMNLKSKGYDAFIFDYKTGDNYMVAVFDNQQILPKDIVLYSTKDDYVIDNNFAVMTRKRILREIEDSSAGTNKAYARRYITTISPTDYLNLTTGTIYENWCKFV